HQAQIHALYWIGRDGVGSAQQHSSHYDHALKTDLGKAGAGYLAGKAALGRCLRRGLEQLGRDDGPGQSPSPDGTTPPNPGGRTDMHDIGKALAEVDAAEADVRSAIGRLVALLLSDEP